MDFWTGVDQGLTEAGIKKALVFAGAVGGVISLRFFEGLDWKGRLGIVFAGAMFANYLTTPILTFMKLPLSDYSAGAGFLLGLGGMSLAAVAIKFIREDLINLIKNFKGGPRA